MATLQFMPITGENVNIQDLKPVGLSSDDMTDEVIIQILDDLGVPLKKYYWINWYEEQDGTTSECWVNGQDEKVDVSFAPGQGLWIESKDGISLQNSGKVGNADVVIGLQKNFTALGNPFPTDVKLQEILPEGLDSDDMTDEVIIQILDDLGVPLKKYYWINWYEEEDGTTGECWVNGQDEKVDVSFAPGQGFWVESKDGISLRFPSPEGL